MQRKVKLFKGLKQPPTEEEYNRLPRNLTAWNTMHLTTTGRGNMYHSLFALLKTKIDGENYG